jgi:hypothetical protein
VSARDALAVGDYSSGPSEHVFIEHWNGTSWHRQV